MKKLLLISLLAVSLCAQRVDNGTTADVGSAQDWSAATTTKPWKTGTTPPPTCSVGEGFQDTDAAAGSQFQVCTSTNTWTVLSAGGSESTTAEDWLDLTGVGVDFRPSLRDMSYLLEEFVGGDDNAGSQIGELGWSRAITGTCTTPDTTGQDGHPGVHRLATGATVNSTCRMFLSHASGTEQFTALDDKTWSLQFTVKLSSAADVLVEIGLAENHTKTQNGFYARLDTAVDGNWKFVTNDASSETVGNSSTAADANWVDGEIRCASSSCDFFLDGVEVVSNQTTNLYSGAVGAFFYIENLTGADKQLDMDAWLTWWLR